MKTKILTLGIVILMIIGSLGAAGMQLIAAQNAKNVIVTANDNNEKPCLPTVLTGDGSKRALVVGVANYPPDDYYDNYNDLWYTDDDAEDMEEVLKNNEWQVTKLISDEDTVGEATASAIKLNLSAIAGNTKDGDISLFHFSGHGTHFPILGAALCTYQGYIFANELGRILNKFNGKVVVILDSCYAGGMKDEGGNISDESVDIFEFMRNFTQELQFGNKKNRVILMACEANQGSYEVSSLRNGVFSFFVTKGLGLIDHGVAPGELPGDTGGDGVATAEELFQYARNETINYMNDRQRPQIFDGNENDGGVPLVESGSDPDPDPSGKALLNITIHRIRMVDDAIDMLSEADFTYKISVYNGNKWVYDAVDYCDNEDDHEKDITSQFVIHTQYPEIKIKVWDRDEFSDDIADVSNNTNIDDDPDLPGTQDPDGRVFELKYNMSRKGINGIIDGESHKYKSDNDGRLFTRGDWDGSTEEEGIYFDAKQDDAQVWFTITDSYYDEDYKPQLYVPKNINCGNHKKKETFTETFKVNNTALKDPLDLPQNRFLDWSIIGKPFWITQIDPSPEDLKAQEEQELTITIDTTNMEATKDGKNYNESINITSNGGDAEIYVAITMPKTKPSQMTFYELLPAPLQRLLQYFFQRKMLFV